MITKIINGRVITDIIEEGKAVYINDDKILAVTKENLPFDKAIDAKGCFVSPGFIDIHVHGGGGYDFMDGGITPIIEGAKMHLRHGTTSIIPTKLACSFDT